MLVFVVKLIKFALSLLFLFALSAPAQADEIMAGLGYDRAHDGHGFDLHKVGKRWVLYFYTYDKAGQPEWYLGIGDMQFETISGEFLRFTYDPQADPPQTEDTEFSGRFFLDFSEAGSARACDDGVAREGAEQLALFEWKIGDESGSWCTEFLRFGQQAGSNPYLGGSWYAGAEDNGYGVNIAHMDDKLVAIAFYYDSQGSPRWALGVSTPETALIKLDHFTGFCRLCAPTPLVTTPAGTFLPRWDGSSEPGSGADKAELALAYPHAPFGQFDRKFTMYRITDGVVAVARQRYAYKPPPLDFCVATEAAGTGSLCAIKPSDLDPAARDIYARGSRADETLGFGYHAVAFPPDGVEIKGVYIHLTGSYGRPYNQDSGAFANRLLLREALEAGYITIQPAYNNRFAVNLDECSGSFKKLAVDNCAGNVRAEKITGEDLSEVTDTPPADSIEQRLIRLFAYLESQGVQFPYALYRDKKINWERVRVGGHSQGATHALYLGKYFGAARVCVLAGGYDVPDLVPSLPPERLADWLLDTSVSLNIGKVRAVTSIDDSSYEKFIRAYAVLGMEKGTHWQSFDGAPYLDTDGKVLSGHAAVVKDPRFSDLRAQACWQ